MPQSRDKTDLAIYFSIHSQLELYFYCVLLLSHTFAAETVCIYLERGTEVIRRTKLVQLNCVKAGKLLCDYYNVFAVAGIECSAHRELVAKIFIV